MGWLDSRRGHAAGQPPPSLHCPPVSPWYLTVAAHRGLAAVTKIIKSFTWLVTELLFPSKISQIQTGISLSQQRASLCRMGTHHVLSISHQAYEITVSTQAHCSSFSQPGDSGDPFPLKHLMVKVRPQFQDRHNILSVL